MLCSINLLFISCFLTTMIKTISYFCVLAIAISMHLQILQMLQGPLPWKHLFRAELHHQEKQERGLVQLWQPEYHINEVIKADYYHLNFLQNIHSNRCLCNVWVYMMAKGIQRNFDFNPGLNQQDAHGKSFLNLTKRKIYRLAT